MINYIIRMCIGKKTLIILFVYDNVFLYYIGQLQMI